MRLPAGTHGLASGASDASNFHVKDILLPNNYGLPRQPKHLNMGLIVTDLPDFE
jgi:hypothetical protein